MNPFQSNAYDPLNRARSWQNPNSVLPNNTNNQLQRSQVMNLNNSAVRSSSPHQLQYGREPALGRNRYDYQAQQNPQTRPNYSNSVEAGLQYKYQPKSQQLNESAQKKQPFTSQIQSNISPPSNYNRQPESSILQPNLKTGQPQFKSPTRRQVNQSQDLNPQSFQQQPQAAPQNLFQSMVSMPPQGPPPPDPNLVISKDDTKKSISQVGILKAFSAHTNPGIFRPYNEDRVSIILNIKKPEKSTVQNWPTCSFFGIYDGHGGETCANFLRDNLHTFVINNSNFPSNPIEAIKIGFKQAENYFLEYTEKIQGEIFNSGSTAIVVIIIENECYVANVGDCRAVLSESNGENVEDLSRDHKPTDEQEVERIKKAGGQILQLQVPVHDSTGKIVGQDGVGPLRVYPGSLSVSRTFGDAQAKLEKLGGNRLAVISDPEITFFKLQPQHDFIILGSDGIFEHCSSKEIVECVWKDVKKNRNQNANDISGSAIEEVMKLSIKSGTNDNISAVLLCFKHLGQDLIDPVDLKSSITRTLKKQYEDIKENFNIVNSLIRNSRTQQYY